MTRMLWMNLLVTAPQLLVFAWALRTTLPLRRPTCYTALCVGLGLGADLISHLLPDPLMYVAALLSFGVELGLLLCFSRETRGRTLVCAAAYWTAMLFADGALCLGYLLITQRSPNSLRDLPELLFLLKLLYLPVMGLLVYLTRLLLRRVLTQAALPAEKGVPLMLLPMSQAIVLNILFYAEGGALSQSWQYFLLGLAVVFSVGVDLVFLVSWRELRRHQQLEQQLDLAQRQLETQMHYYQKLQENVTAVNRIRHDLNNQLQTAYTLLQSGASDQARAQLDTIRQELQRRVGTVFCANLMADAVLTEKAAVCRERDIALQVDAQLPPTLAVDGAHLCSALTNILDNAVQGCQGCHPAWIEFSAWVQAGCLTLRCRNSAQANSRKARHSEIAGLPRHGLGLGILRRLAEIYHGEVQTRQEDGAFTVVLLLPLAASA